MGNAAGELFRNDAVTSRYSAFLSYSHADAHLAQKLHSRLETYRLPRAVAHADKPGIAPRRLGPVFRDREEFPAAQDLSEAVKAALSNSDSLVVLCSPHSRNSQWVAREIELFRQVAPGRPILAAILHGDPAEVFPPPLLETGEPLAADLRKEGDGQKLGFLKVVAGIAVVPLNQLVQRDAQRQARRVMAITLATSAAAVAMAIMTIIAIQSRDEAERQRSEAEGLVEYMLTDLRSELRGVGRLDVMTGVNTRALDYYEDQGNLSALPADSLERRARVLHAMVEDETERLDGDLDLAEKMARDALATTANLLERDQSSADRIFAQAQSEYWLGYVFEMREDYQASREWYDKYNQRAHDLNAVEPDTRRTDLERAWGALNLGIVSHRTGQSRDEVVALFETSIARFGEALARDPDDDFIRGELANAHSWLSNVHYWAGDFAGATGSANDALRLRRKVLESDPENQRDRFFMLVAERAVALNHIRMGNRVQGLAQLRRTTASLKNLSERDPDNASWREVYDKARKDLEEFQ